MKKSMTYYPTKVVAEVTIAHYKVVASQVAYYSDERIIAFMVEFMNGFKRVEQVTYPSLEDAMRIYTYWVEEVIPVQLAKEAFGLAKPMTANPISEAETTYQP